MKMGNFIFYILIFVGFFLPTNNNMYIPLPGVLLKVNELAFLLLPGVNIFCKSSIKPFKLGNKLKYYIVSYLLLVLVTEFILKKILFGQSIIDGFKGFRIGLPLFSTLILLYSGIRPNIQIVWKTILLAVGVSVILSISSIFVYLPIYYGMEDEDSLSFMAGRIMNSNASFGLIGLFLLFLDKDKWYNHGRLVKIVSILSIVSLVIAFNRTYLMLLFILFIYLFIKTFSLRSFIKITLYLTVFAVGIIFAYNKNETIQSQINRRILAIIFSEVSISESTIDNNRDFIYEGIALRLKEGYWVIGMPFKTPIFTRTSFYGSEQIEMTITDTSIVNILLRYGIIPLFLVSLTYIQLFKSSSGLFTKILILLFFLASLNLDSLFRHNSVFFIMIIYIITSLYNDKNLFFSQDRLNH